MAAEADVAIEGGALDPNYREALDLLEELLLFYVSTWIQKQPSLAPQATAMLRAFLNERYGERAEDLMPAAILGG